MISPASTIRARRLGFPFSGQPGKLNSITDVDSIAVGYTTLWTGSGALQVGIGPVRTGVTAILPRGRKDTRPCFGGSFALNGAGEVTGLAYLEERGLFEGPLLITNTHSVGTVRDAAIQWMRREGWSFDWTIPIVAETYDGLLNDINGGHINSTHAFAALDAAASGPIAEGNVGGGAGMITYWYKGGTGTASRVLSASNGGYKVGVLVQSNYGTRRDLRIAGIPMGDHLAEDLPRYLEPSLLSDDIRTRRAQWCQPGEGSIIVVVATDAPLLPHQLRRLAKRPSLAIGRLGGVGAATSGDIFVAFSTANGDMTELPDAASSLCTVSMHPNRALTALFEAAIDATEEAILNALVAAEACEGANRLHIPRLPHERTRDILRAHNLLRDPDEDALPSCARQR